MYVGSGLNRLNKNKTLSNVEEDHRVGKGGAHNAFICSNEMGIFKGSRFMTRPTYFTRTTQKKKIE